MPRTDLPTAAAYALGLLGLLGLLCVLRAGGGQ